MKRNDLAEIKKINVSEIINKVKKLKNELSDLQIDKNMNKLKNVKDIKNKRRDLAQMLTVLQQKQLLAKLEAKNGK